MASLISAAPPDAQAVLAACPLFEGLDQAALADLVGQMEWLTLPGGQPLFYQGQEGNSLYIVMSGRLRVVVEAERGTERLVREVGRGETVGEMALLTGEPRSATVFAVRDTELGRLSRAKFDHLLEEHPRTILRLTRMLASWLVSANRPVPKASVSTTVTVVPVGEHVPLGPFTDRLAAALGRVGSTLHLNPERLDACLGAGAAQADDDHADHARITGWLSAQEVDHRFVLYEADAEPSVWTRRCLRQADRLFVVADASAEPGLGPAAAAILAQGDARARVAMDLVLLHADPTSDPIGTQHWLELAPFDNHYHVRSPEVRDFDRLARNLAGAGIGLVLGGGGARGFAHIGVLMAMEEAGIPVDHIGGTSMGAVIAAQYACGVDPRDMVALNRHGWLGFKPHKDYTVPVISLLSDTSARAMLEMMFGERQIEDLWLSYFCVSTNLTRSEIRVHRNGPVRRAVRASIAIPGTAPPELDTNGDLLVDGGVLNNLPVNVMRRFSEGPVVAVDVSPAVDLAADHGHVRVPSPWRLMLNAVKRKASRRYFPSIFQILYRTAVLSSIRSAKGAKREADLCIEPPVGGFETLEMDSIERIVEVGYDAARQELAHWIPRPSGTLRRASGAF